MVAWSLISQTVEFSRVSSGPINEHRLVKNLAKAEVCFCTWSDYNWIQNPTWHEPEVLLAAPARVTSGSVSGSLGSELCSMDASPARAVTTMHHAMLATEKLCLKNLNSHSGPRFQFLMFLSCACVFCSYTNIMVNLQKMLNIFLTSILYHVNIKLMYCYCVVLKCFFFQLLLCWHKKKTMNFSLGLV